MRLDTKPARLMMESKTDYESILLDRGIRIGFRNFHEGRRDLLPLNHVALRSLGYKMRSMCGLGEVPVGGRRVYFH